MAAPALNGAREFAVTAEGISKRYRLGEHQSLALTARRLLRRPVGAEPQAFDALSGVDFTCCRGETLGIIGTNGSGKSTLLQILAGTTLPTAGEMRVRGRVVPLLSVGSGFHPELTGRENMTLFATSIGIPRKAIEERVDSVRDFAELERHMDTPIKRYSSGMISRLSFAIAMQLPADVYVFDEVLAVVDTEFQARCLEEIRGLHDQGRTVMFVSHHRHQVVDVCDRVLWLEDGVVRQLGSASDVLDAYESVHGAAVSGHVG